MIFVCIFSMAIFCVLPSEAMLEVAEAKRPTNAFQDVADAKRPTKAK